MPSFRSGLQICFKAFPIAATLGLTLSLGMLVGSSPASGEPPGRVRDGLIVLYDFAEGKGTTVHDVSRVLPAMNLTIEDLGNVSWLADGGLRIDQPTIVETFAPAAKLLDSGMASNEISVEAWIYPANLTQDGPARIAALTGNPVDPSNFMLGQGRWNQQDPEVIDARCPLNTHLPSTQTPPGSLELGLTHVVFTRDLPTNANRIYLNGELLATSLRVGDFSDWDTSYHLNVANDQTRDRPWLGTLYLIAVYDRDLSAEEIIQNLHAGPTSPPMSIPAVTKEGAVLLALALLLAACSLLWRGRDPEVEGSLRARWRDWRCDPETSQPPNFTRRSRGEAIRRTV